MWLIATTITLFVANVRVMAGRVEILDRNPTGNCGTLDCGLRFCTRSADKLVQSVSGVSMQQGTLATLTTSTSLVPLYSKVNLPFSRPVRHWCI